MKKKILLVLLAVCLLVGTLSLGAFAAPELTDEEILAQRRDIAEAYMRQMTSVIWRAEEDLVYTTASEEYAYPADAEAAGKKVFKVKAGELYLGMPYSYAGGGWESFMDYCTEPDENGVYTVSGLSWEALSGNSTCMPRIGNDCSGAVMRAYTQIGNSFVLTTTSRMVESRGFLKVGEYEGGPDPDRNKDTLNTVCKVNGEQTMYEAYAQLQKADAVVAYYTSAGHTRMVVSVKVVRNSDGTINGTKSTVTMLEQTSNLLTNSDESKRRYFDEELGEYVNVFCGVDMVYTFRTLYYDGYLPITIKELVDPTAPATPYVTDTVAPADLGADTLLSGELQTNYLIDKATITITDDSGKVVQQAIAAGNRYAVRNSLDAATRYYYFAVDQFVTDKPSTVLGYVNPDKLAPGNYHCKLELQLSKDGAVYTMRDYDFTVGQKNTTIDHTGTVCPLCGAQDAQWETIPMGENGTDEIALSGTKHYYLDKNVAHPVDGTEAGRHYYTVKDAAVVCVDLNGKNLSSTYRAFIVNAGGTLNITGPDSSVVTGGAVGSYYGMALDVSGTVNIYGGTYKHHYDTNPVVGLRDPAAVVNMYGGVIDGTTAANDTDSVYPNVLIAAGTFSMHGGKVTAGNAGSLAYGGNFYVGYIPDGGKAQLSKLYIYGGTIENGTAKNNGGNIYAVNRGEVYIRNDAYISGGKATDYHGGNVAVGKDGFVQMTGGTVTGGKATANRGGNIYVASGGSFHMSGGTLEKGSAKNGGNLESYGEGAVAIISGGLVSEGSASSRGGNLYAYGSSSSGLGLVRVSGTADIYKGSANDGGNICAYGGTIVINNGTIRDGKATTNGGNVQAMKEGTVTILSGTIKDGKASAGGNIYAQDTGAITIKGGTIDNGNASTGGNIYVLNTATITIEDGTIKEGKANTYGGNIYAQDTSVVTIQGGTIKDGEATTSGGNVYAKSGADIILKNGAKIQNGKNVTSNQSGGSVAITGSGTTFTMGADANDTCSITGGNAARWGGNAFVGSSAHFILQGGTISGGTGSAGRNVALYDAKMTMTGGSVVSSSSTQGNGIYVSGSSTLNLGGTAKVLGTNNRRTGNIWVNTDAKLQVDNNFAGDASVLWANSFSYGSTVTAARGACGNTSASSFTASGTYTGKLTHETVDGMPNVFGIDGSLVVAGAQVVGQTTRWVANNAAAVAAVQNGEYIKLFTDKALELTKDACVDINGHTVSASGSGMLYGMNSAATGSVTATCPVADYAQSYLAIGNENVYNFYTIDMALSAVVLRPETAGVYYKVRYNCDSVVGERISYRGIAMSVASMPTENFVNEGYVIYTKLNGAPDFSDEGVAENSCIVNNILTAETAAENDANGKTPIYARPYVAIDKDGDGDADYTVVAGLTESGDYSLLDVLKAIDGSWASFEPQQETLKNRYNQWKNWNINWDLDLPNFVK